MEGKKRKTKRPIKAEPPLNQIIHGHNIRVMRKFSDNSIDSIVTDPPYGLEFMGKEWDKLGAKIGSTTERWSADGKPSIPSGRVCYGKSAKSMQHWHYRWAKECLRVAKPGAFMFVFGGTRTFHRLTCAIEDAGWQIRDCMMWLYGSGFPKSLDISKAIDKAKGKKERPIIGEKRGANRLRSQTENGKRCGEGRWGNESGRDPFIHSAVTKLAKLWDGYGTALKPAWEPIIVAMKPVDSNFAKNAEKYGVAGLNIAGGRIPSGTEHFRGEIKYRNKGTWSEAKGMHTPGRGFIASDNPQGRWPANVILDEDAAKILDKQAPLTGAFAKVRSGHSGKSKGIYGDYKQRGDDGLTFYNDFGGASRFFYIAKSSRSERNAGLSGTEARQVDEQRKPKNPGGNNPRNRGARKDTNFHPTVKPLQLMQYLCMLLKMPNKDQVILDPFVGSGTTCVACKELGINYIGIDDNEDYCKIARKRLKNVKPSLFEKPKKKKMKKKESLGL